MKRHHLISAAAGRLFLHAFFALAVLGPFAAARAEQSPAAAVPADLTAKNVLVGDRLILGGSIVPVAETLAAAASPKQATILRATLADEELDASLTFEVSLTMRGLDALREHTARDERLTPAELEANHLPAQADFDALGSWLTDQGFTIKKRDGNRLAIFARGTVSQAQNAFQTRFALVSVAGESHVAAVSAPSVPASLKSVLAVTGLQPFIRSHVNSHPATRFRGPVTNTANKPPYLVSEILHALSADTTSLTGTGQEIGIIIDVLPVYDDLTEFWSYNQINHTGDLSTEDANVTGQSESDASEASLDVEWSTGIAPAADETIFTTGSLQQADTDSAYSTIGTELKNGDHPELHTLSISYSQDEDGAADSYLMSEQQYFATIASYGVTILVCSGDNGAFDESGALSVQYPTSDPSVTGVGGVSIALDSSTGAVASEIGWSADADGFSDGRIAASGGGLSRLPRPSWQKGTGVPGGTTRCVPDVAASADQNEPGVLVLTDPTTNKQQTLPDANGTSWAAPTWGGLVALLNEGRANNKLAPVGLLNPKIYPLIGTSSFRDITQSSNSHDNKTDGYSARKGYDLVTGVGTPIFSNLLAALTAAAPTITSFSPNSGPVGSSVVINGTGFAPPISIVFAGNVNAGGSFTATQITATVPSGAETGPIMVYTNGGSATTGTFTVTTGAAKPVITSPTSATATQGSSFSYHITATNSPTSYAATGLPAGLTLDTTSGSISGAANSAGTATVTISATNGGGTGSATLTITIAANPAGTLAFGTASYSVHEDAGSITVHVLRSGGSTGAVSVTCGTEGGTAKSGTDYTGISTTLSWAAGDTSQKAFTVVLDDPGITNGSTRQFSLKLASPTNGATLGSPATATVTIEENDPAQGELEFAAASYSVDETAGTLTVQVKRTVGSTGAVSVTCGTESGTAKSGTDYTGKSTTLSWAAGDTTQKAFTVALDDPGITNGSTRQFSLKLSSPTNGATLGSVATATVTVAENDPAQGELEFAAASYSVDETAGTLTVQVKRTVGSTDTASVTCGTESGTAKSGTDYTGTSKTLSWTTGDTSQKSFTVAIKNRGASGGNGLKFSLVLSSPEGGAILGDPATVTVTIN